MGDVLLTGSLQTQRILLGSTSNGDAMLALDSNRTMVGGDLVAHRAAASVFQGTGLVLGVPDPSNLAGLVSFPPFAFSGLAGATMATDAAAAATSNQAFGIGALGAQSLTVARHLLPAPGLLLDLGSSSARFRNAFLSSNLSVGGALTVEGTLTARDVQYSNVTVFQSQETRSNMDVQGRLAVQGPVTLSNVLTAASNAGVQGTLHVWNYGNSNSGSNAAALSVAGNIVAAQDITAFGQVLDISDSNLKTGLAPIEGALARVSALTGYTFAMRADPSGRRRMGLLAQDVLAVAPEAVQEQEGGSLSVAYGSLIGLLVEAVKELAAGSGRS